VLFATSLTGMLKWITALIATSDPPLMPIPSLNRPAYLLRVIDASQGADARRKLACLDPVPFIGFLVNYQASAP
jgi:hypothetical protein